jgi:hypothetical protein
MSHAQPHIRLVIVKPIAEKQNSHRVEITRLHPRDFIWTRRQTAANVRQRGRDNLDIQQRNEKSHAHHAEGKNLRGHRKLADWRPRFCGDRIHEPALPLTFAVTDRPGRNCPCVAPSSSSTMRTATRWTIFVKFPVAFSGGSTLNCAPVAGAMLMT